MVGSCGLGRRPSGLVELGYWIARPFWGCGYATEASIALIDIARALGIAQLEGSHFLDNPASGRVLEKLGFQSTGLIAPRLSCARGTEAQARMLRLSLTDALALSPNTAFIKLEEFTGVPDVVDMAVRLGEDMSEDWNPEQYKDTFQEQIMALVEQKAREGKIEAVGTPDAEQPRSADILDLTELLKRSLGGKSAAKPADEPSEKPAAKPKRAASKKKPDEEPPAKKRSSSPRKKTG